MRRLLRDIAENRAVGDATTLQDSQCAEPDLQRAVRRQRLRLSLGDVNGAWAARLHFSVARPNDGRWRQLSACEPGRVHIARAARSPTGPEWAAPITSQTCRRLIRAPRSSSSCSAQPETWPSEWSSRRSSHCWQQKLLPERFPPGRQRARRRLPRGLPRPRARRAHRVRHQTGGQGLGGVRRPAAVRRRRFRHQRPRQPAGRHRRGQRRTGRRCAAGALLRGAAGGVRRTDRRARRSTASPRAPGSSTRSRSARHRRTSGSWTRPCTRCSKSRRSTGSTISWARRPPRICTCCGSRTACSPDAWNAEHIKAIQIDAPENLDIDDRALFYDATGAMLDMLITHLFQVAAEVAMEPPASMSRRRPAIRPRGGDRLLPSAGPGRGGPRPVRRLPRRQGHQARTRRPTPSSPPGCGWTTTAGAACRS